MQQGVLDQSFLRLQSHKGKNYAIILPLYRIIFTFLDAGFPQHPSELQSIVSVTGTILSPLPRNENWHLRQCEISTIVNHL